jgi:hypothetical protein
VEFFVFINVYSGHTTCMCSLIVGRERHCPINWYISDLDTIRNSKRQIPLRWDVIGKKIKKWDSWNKLSPMKSQTVPYVHRCCVYHRLTVFLYLVIHINPLYIWMMFSDWVIKGALFISVNSSLVIVLKFIAYEILIQTPVERSTCKN